MAGGCRGSNGKQDSTPNTLAPVCPALDVKNAPWFGTIHSVLIPRRHLRRDGEIHKETDLVFGLKELTA
jgi:hypothetical protein